MSDKQSEKPSIFRPENTCINVSSNGKRISQVRFYDENGVWFSTYGLNRPEESFRAPIVELYAGKVRSAMKLNFTKGDAFTLKCQGSTSTNHFDLYLPHEKIEGEEYLVSESSVSKNFALKYHLGFPCTTLLNGQKVLHQTCVVQTDHLIRREHTPLGEKIQQIQDLVNEYGNYDDEIRAETLLKIFEDYEITVTLKSKKRIFT